MDFDHKIAKDEVKWYNKLQISPKNKKKIIFDIVIDFAYVYSILAVPYV
jgi:hypothetical protein